MKNFFSKFIFYKRDKIRVDNSPINSLAPKILTDENDIEKIRPYLESLKKTINAKGITNIALTGGYGSGKSTIIKTFQELNKGYEYLNISLASFSDVAEEIEDIEEKEKSIDENKDLKLDQYVEPVSFKKLKIKQKKDELERLLEVSILQQIFYHVKPSQIPDSRFKRIINLTDNRLFAIASCLIIWIVSAIILFKFNYINKINPSNWSIEKQLDLLSIVFLICFFSGIGLMAKTIVRLFSNSKISKFNIKGELELGDNLDKSVFNEHLEEILYFFERTEYNVVIIEDLDRFESTDIFTKLREINILLNNSKLIEREINFIYAIKDEMFKDKSERVKFFEYIIPVIPFINPSNAGEQVTKLILAAKLEGVLSKDFTEDVVTFIDDIDMRLLTNIFHEYQLYRQNLSEDLNQNNLFAIITYKNMFPDDFGDLHKRKGNLYEFISNKDYYISKLTTQTNILKSSKQIEIKNIEGGSEINLKELKAIYLNAFFEKFKEATAIQVDSSKKNINELLLDQNFDLLAKSNNISYTYNLLSQYYTNHYTIAIGNSGISFSDLEKLVSSNLTYSQRKKIIIDKKEKRVNDLKIEIENLNKKVLDFEAWSLSQIFEELDINHYLKGLSKSQLVRNLLLNGYIDENYSDYISLFHGVNLTKEDYTFERRVKSGVYSIFDYKLTNLENLVKKIQDKYFKRDVILNISLIHYLSDNHSDNIDKFNSIIRVLSNGKKRSTDFIDHYIDQKSEFLGLFIKSICKSWKGFWDYILKESDYTEEKINFYLMLIIKYSDLEDIVTFGANFNSYMQDVPDFLVLPESEKYHQKIEEIIKKLGTKFKNLGQNKNSLYNFVYENNSYQINKDNINLILLENGIDVYTENLERSNYTIIMRSNCLSLISYVNSNINFYVKTVLLTVDRINEDEANLVKLLNNDDIDENLKFTIIDLQESSLSKLSLISNIDIQTYILNCNKVQPSWENVFVYYETIETKELDELLIGFLNTEDNYETLSAKPLREVNGVTEEFVEEFSLKLINCNELSLDAYVKLLDSTPYKWNSLNFENLDANKVKWMVKTKFLSLSSSNFEKLKEHFVGEHITLIEYHQALFVLKFNEYTLDEHDINSILTSKEVLDKNKLSIIKKVDDSIIMESEKLGKTICFLLADSEYIEISYDLLESLFIHTASIEKRVKLLNLHLSKLSNMQIQTLIEMLNNDYKEIFKRQHKPKFKKIEYNIILFNELVKRGLIIRFEEFNKDNSMLKVFANY